MMEATTKNARRSRAQNVIDKARRTNAAQGNIKDLPTTRLERGVVGGRPTLTAIFTKKGGGEPDRLDLNFLLEFPGLTDLFAEGILKWGKPQRQVTRTNLTKDLRAHWFSYLIEHRLTKIVPSQVDEQIMTAFWTSLHQALKADGKPLHPNTIAHALSVLRNVLSSAPGAGQWLDFVPAGPRGANRKAEPTEVLQFDQLLQVMAAVEKEVLALRDRWEEGRRLLTQGNSPTSTVIASGFAAQQHLI